MIHSDPQHEGRPWGMGKPALYFALLSFVLLLGVGVVTQMLFDMPLPSMFIFAVITGLSLRGVLQSYPHEELGACNGVTLFRAALIAVLFGAIFVPVSAWIVFSIAVVAFALDGFDGWLARRAGLESAFGARFDMEIDALLGAVLALVLLASGTVGYAILVLGFSRYVFVIAGIVWPVLQGDLPQSMRRKTICVIQIAALIILIFPLTPAALLTPVAVTAAAALLYSFALDALFLARRGA
ncbi:Phosphatidylglycerophosphate synthase [Cognatiyoonia koreensis]|uniref:Phosphatidylglycerophosphate synthase n=1 Tax=Cognatiyoonia koreensis TaxID=364200 RepID=A0A1I0QXG3_9RHOB|nr:CDP-alcohol phosphatidyltransferase family protein [Cognatiyoonia koreensis]SEW32246.1 Phosphatidylglycerophosphate synthase [Cognatiyoonia koreensis]